ncbi:BglG family transcription antiterminator [Streptococcus sp. 20-1249]|uniref:BglG family transcription antiterminator n=1 Tax=Streptococcus hepaticus TaxID=3349163 RepID=UPI00374A6336
MLLTKREEQLLKAFLEVGKLSLKEMAEILQVSSRTVYRTLSDLTVTLATEDIFIVKEGKKYHLSGNLDTLQLASSVEEFSASERQLRIAYTLLTNPYPMTNEQLQDIFLVSNVTIIQDMATLEKRMGDFELQLVRGKGYKVEGGVAARRRFLANLLTNAISVHDFWHDEFPNFAVLHPAITKQIRQVFEEHQVALGELDVKLKEFLIILLALADNQGDLHSQVNVSKDALDISQKLFADLAKTTKHFYNIQEIVYFANILDEVILKRQEVPLFREKFDSEFYYNVSQLVDSVSRFTKIDFIKDKMLFKLLFNHLKLSLAVPQLFPEHSASNVAYLATQNNQFLHSLVSLLMKDIFPPFIQSEYEYELVTLHFAASLRRSPDIYPIRLLLLTDERPLTTSVLVSKIKNIAPFVELIDVKSTTDLSHLQLKQYDYCLSTKPISQDGIALISTFPNTQEILDLQETLQHIQGHRTISAREDIRPEITYDLQAYIQSSSHLLQEFDFVEVDNHGEFAETVHQILEGLAVVTDSDYLAKKILARFETSPLAIPHTNLALLHTQSSKVEKSQFMVVELRQPVQALSMNYQQEEVKRILVMLTTLDESQETRNLMTAISQSIIENKLYTEIYRAGNRDIIYHLLNTIFTENIKKLEN